jgi:hypothetical protein
MRKPAKLCANKQSVGAERVLKLNERLLVAEKVDEMICFWKNTTALALASGVLLCAFPAFARTVKPAVTLCGAKEKTVFSCPLTNGKTVSVCASTVLTKDSGWMQYRFGRVGKKTELVYPTERKHPREAFWLYSDAISAYPDATADSAPSGMWSDPSRYLAMRSKQYVYELNVYSNKGTDEHRANLSVKQDASPGSPAVSEFTCLWTKVTNNVYQLQEIGLPLRAQTPKQ